jgi:hypothetical protein
MSATNPFYRIGPGLSEEVGHEFGETAQRAEFMSVNEFGDVVAAICSDV